MKEAIQKTKDVLLTIVMLLLRAVPIENNKIIFMSYFGKEYSDNPMLISKELENREDIKIVWATEKNVKCPKGVTQVYMRSLQYLYELATAKAWVDNARKRIWAKKRRGQFYIQTWHGPVCIKAVERDAGTSLDKLYIKSAIQDSKNADLIVAECRWRKNNIEEAFWYDGEILEAEFKTEEKPTEERKCAVENYFRLNRNDRIVLYAPTFRKDSSVKAYSLDYTRLISYLKKDGDNWKIIVRMHPNISSNAGLIQYSDDILNGTPYPDMVDLIYRADYIITDYSGVMFEAFRARKKVLLYAADIDEYISTNRKLYFDISSLPSPLARNNDELIRNIDSFDEEEYEKKRERLVEDLGYYEENAQKKCAEILLNKILNEKK